MQDPTKSIGQFRGTYKGQGGHYAVQFSTQYSEWQSNKVVQSHHQISTGKSTGKSRKIPINLPENLIYKSKTQRKKSEKNKLDFPMIWKTIKPVDGNRKKNWSICMKKKQQKKQRGYSCLNTSIIYTSSRKINITWSRGLECFRIRIYFRAWALSFQQSEKALRFFSFFWNLLFFFYFSNFSFSNLFLNFDFFSIFRNCFWIFRNLFSIDFAKQEFSAHPISKIINELKKNNNKENILAKKVKRNLEKNFVM